MKKFTFLLSLPLLAVLAIAFLLMVADDSDNFQSRDVVIGIDEHCSEEANYIDCAFYELAILRAFAFNHHREPYPDNSYAQNDKGGCDLDFLKSFSYKDERDKKQHQTKIKSCSNWYAKHAVEILLGENYTTKQVTKLYDPWNKSEAYNFTNSIAKDRKDKFIEYMKLNGEDALVSFCEEKVGMEWGFLLWETCTQMLKDLPEQSRFSFETRAFSIWAFLLGLAPLLLLTGLIYYVFDKWSPILSSATVS